MRLDPKNRIAGLPIKTARDLMRYFSDYNINADTVLDFLNDEHWRKTVDAACKANPRIPRGVRQRDCLDDYKSYCKIWRFKFTPVKAPEAECVFEALVAEGYFEPNEKEHGDKRKYQRSQKGMQLAAANLTKRFDRATADAEVVALIERANEINKRDELVCYISKITVFGSYLTDNDDLGDIDLIIETASRRDSHTDESHYRADSSGKSLDWMGGLYYGEREVKQLLRARKARLSFCSTTLLDQLDTKFKVIFEWKPDKTRRAEMEAFDWRLHEPLRQVKEWLAENHGINADPVDMARWCQEVAAILKARDWSDNFAQAMMPHWGLTTSQAASATMHDIEWADYRKRGIYWIEGAYKRPADAVVESQLYGHFTRAVTEWNAAKLLGRHFGWKLAEGQHFFSERDDDIEISASS